MGRFGLTMLLVFACCAAFGAEAPLSGVYLHPVEYADAPGSAEERAALVDAALDKVAACGFTTLIPYANTSAGRDFWPSGSPETSSPGDWDALGVLAEKARARGLRVMPGFCMLISGHEEPRGILAAHPEWALRAADGTPQGYISPANPAARAWVVAHVRSMAAHIRPDGIMLDYLRYPSQGNIRLDPEGEKAFESQAPEGETPAARKVRFQQFKEDAISALMADLHAMLQEEAPGIRTGLYTWGASVASGSPVGQCWPRWVRAGMLDVLNVSGYCYTENYGEKYMEAFDTRLRDAAALARGAGGKVELTFALGVVTSHGGVKKPEEIGEYLAVARKAGYDGVAAFAWRTMEKYTDDAVRAGWFKLSPAPGDTGK